MTMQPGPVPVIVSADVTGPGGRWAAESNTLILVLGFLATLLQDGGEIMCVYLYLFIIIYNL